jgi:hypothetical protein
MTRDDIENMARKAGVHEGSPCDECGEVNPLWQFGTEELWQFGFRIAAAEREACADICDQNSTCEGIAQKCAAAIRARGEP